MKRLNLPLVLDTLFAAMCAFLLFFTAIRFYTQSAVIALVFGISASLLFGALGYLYISAKQKKTMLITRDEKQKKLLALHLSLSADDYIKKLLQSCLEGAKIRGKRLILGEQCCFYDFKMQPLTEDDIARVIKYKWEKDKILYCVRLSPEAAVLAENFSIKVIGIDGVYKLLSENKQMPEKFVYEDAKKISFFKKIKLRFSRRLAAPLFWSGAALIALSYITFFPIYYIISGGIMLILASVALIFN